MKIYAYDLVEKIKFETTVKQILTQINDSGIFSDDEFFYTSKKDRDRDFDLNYTEEDKIFDLNFSEEEEDD